MFYSRFSSDIPNSHLPCHKQITQLLHLNYPMEKAPGAAVEYVLMVCNPSCRVPITVYMLDNKTNGLQIIAEYGQEYGKENPVRVLYHGYGHYDALQSSFGGLQSKMYIIPSYSTCFSCEDASFDFGFQPSNADYSFLLKFLSPFSSFCQFPCFFPLFWQV